MDYRNRKRIWNRTSSSSDNPSVNSPRTFSLRQHKWLRFVLLTLAVPFATLSTATVKAQASWLGVFNPVPEETQTKFSSVINTVFNVIAWVKKLDENISQISIDVLLWSYDKILSVVLHTPSFLFNNDFFAKNIAMFTGLSIILSMSVSIYDGFRRMLSHFINTRTVTDLGRISKRLPIVITISALTPSLFYYGSKGLNWLTNMIIDLGKYSMGDNMTGLSVLNFSLGTQKSIDAILEIILLVGFNIAILGIMIPVFLSNFRRWFDLLSLGLLTPVALACWQFKSLEHYFNMYWTHLKRCASVQLMYATFLMIIGILIFGTGSPDSFSSLIIKLGIILGGFARMAFPPSIIKSKLATGDDIYKMYRGAKEAVTPDKRLVEGAKNTKDGIRYAKVKGKRAFRIFKRGGK